MAIQSVDRHPNGGSCGAVIGQAGRSYLLAQSPAGIFIVDQHAAHERILFEEFFREMTAEPVDIQRLLAPINLEPGPRQAALIAEKIPLLRDMGIEVESFGRDAFIITALPALLTKWGKEDLVLEVLGTVDEWEKSPDDPRRSIIIRLACLAAVKARDSLDPRESDRLIERLFCCREPDICPHGRPTMIKHSWNDLEKMFKRT